VSGGVQSSCSGDDVRRKLEIRRSAQELQERRRIEELRELQHRQRREKLEQQLREEAAPAKAVAWEAEAEAEDDDNDDIDWSDDGPDLEEQAAQQWAIVESVESRKKLQDDARACEEDNDVRWCHDVELSLQQEPEQQRRGSNDAAGRRLLVTLQRERRRAANEQRRSGGNDGAGPSNAPSGGQ
jgi:hypothetical protein